MPNFQCNFDNFVGQDLSFIAINGLKFLIFRDKSKCEKNATYTQDDAIAAVDDVLLDCLSLRSKSVEVAVDAEMDVEAVVQHCCPYNFQTCKVV